MKNVEPSIGTSKRPRGEASTATPTSGDMLVVEEIHVDPTTTMDPSGDDDAVDPTVTTPLSLHVMMEFFMTTQAAHGQLLDELITELVALLANFSEYRSVFPPPAPFDP